MIFRRILPLLQNVKKKFLLWKHKRELLDISKKTYEIMSQCVVAMEDKGYKLREEAFLFTSDYICIFFENTEDDLLKVPKHYRLKDHTLTVSNKYHNNRSLEDLALGIFVWCCFLKKVRRNETRDRYTG